MALKKSCVDQGTVSPNCPSSGRYTIWWCKLQKFISLEWLLKCLDDRVCVLEGKPHTTITDNGNGTAILDNGIDPAIVVNTLAREIVTTAIGAGDTEVTVASASNLTTVQWFTAEVRRNSGTEEVGISNYTGGPDNPTVQLDGTPSAAGTHDLIVTYWGTV